MKISPSSPATAIAKSQEAVQKNLKRLASGRRIGSASDDAAGLAIAQTLSAQEQSHAVASRNAVNGAGMLQIADGSLAGQQESLGRLRELAVQSGNGTLSDSDRQAIQAEANGLLSELDRTADSTEFNGTPLLADTSTSTFQVGIDSKGAQDQVTATIAGSTTNHLGINGLDLSTPGAATSSLGALDGAIQQVSQNRAGIGASIERLKSAYETSQAAQESASRSRSTIEDADVAAEASDLASNQIQQYMAIAVEAQSRISASASLRLLA